MNIQSTSSPEAVEIINKFLQTHASGTLATADSAANPHAAVVYITPNEDLTFSFVTKTETQKYKNIEENSSIAFAIYDEKDQASVQVTGRAKIVKDRDAIEKLVNTSFKYSAEISHREFPPIEKLFAGEYVAVQIVPQVVKMAVFARPESGADELYEVVLLSED